MRWTLSLNLHENPGEGIVVSIWHVGEPVRRGWVQVTGNWRSQNLSPVCLWSLNSFPCTSSYPGLYLKCLMWSCCPLVLRSVRLESEWSWHLAEPEFAVVSFLIVLTGFPWCLVCLNMALDLKGSVPLLNVIPTCPQCLTWCLCLLKLYPLLQSKWALWTLAVPLIWVLMSVSSRIHHALPCVGTACLTLSPSAFCQLPGIRMEAHSPRSEDTLFVQSTTQPSRAEFSWSCFTLGTSGPLRVCLGTSLSCFGNLWE